MPVFINNEVYRKRRPKRIYLRDLPGDQIKIICLGIMNLAFSRHDGTDLSENVFQALRLSKQTMFDVIENRTEYRIGDHTGDFKMDLDSSNGRIQIYFNDVLNDFSVQPYIVEILK